MRLRRSGTAVKSKNEADASRVCLIFFILLVPYSARSAHPFLAEKAEILEERRFLHH